MKKIAYLSLLIFSAFFAQAQSLITVRGTVLDTTKLSVIGAAVKLATATDTILTSTNVDGGFVFNNVKSNQFSITITSLGYQIAKRSVVVKPNVKQEILSPIILKNDSKMLNEIVVNGTPEVTVKEDTLQYRADMYKLKENALAEDLLKKLPGVEVDKDGNVTAQGKEITRIRINGKDFFGGDVKTATQQLPADVIKNVQVIDDYGDQANITGVKSGDAEKILNFTIREDKNKGYLTRGVIGGGNSDRYQGSVFAAGFNNNRQLALLANFNNVNANVFNLSNTGGGRRRGNYNPDDRDGLTNVSSIGFNYRDNWGSKITAYGSYSFSNKDNTISSKSLQDILTQDNTFYNNNFNNAGSVSNGHRIDFNFEYKIDSLNYLKISPKISYSKNKGDTFTNFDINTQDIVSKGTSQEFNNYTKPNYGTDILYNHRFGAKARNLSLNASLNSSSNSQNQDYLYNSNDNTPNGQIDSYQKQLIFGDNKNNNVELKVSYQEPITSTKNLEFNYTYGFARADNDRTVESTKVDGGTPVFDPLQSNQYQFDYITNKFGLNYRVNEKKYNYNVGFSAQPSVLKSNTNVADKSETNLFPNARFSYKFSKTRELSFTYDGRSNQPDYSQLQPITDQSNKSVYVTGNPDLRPEFSNSMRLRYANFDFATSNVLFASISYSSTNNKIVTNTITSPIAGDPSVLRENRYLNTDGYYNLNGFYAFSKPFQEKKYVLRFRGSAIYNNNISFIDDAKNTGKNLILSQRVGLQINPVEWFELTPEATYTYNKNANTLNNRANTEVNSLGFNIDTKIYFLKTWIFGGKLDKTFNSGYSTISSNPLIINSYLEKQFLKGKKASFKLQAFDILDQSTSLSYAATGNTTTLSESNRLARYFLLSFTFNFSKFAGKSSEMPDMGGGGYRRH
ncbi:outer membrane beta-barrel protein [Pedobacter arcticus]|uniref:outer membrane beta-barrel protein n=1 Tax=Pedobacter arcticus TaxID=752140 RepID=UPI0002E7A944|nr:outer membrane beta-barrel protein [Pedobacter arcticus]